MSVSEFLWLYIRDVQIANADGNSDWYITRTSRNDSKS
jgi:hypothetical protein